MLSCTHGLWATWKEVLATVKKQRADPACSYVPVLPKGIGERVGDDVLGKLEAAQSAVA